MCLSLWYVNIICMYNFDLQCNIYVSFWYGNVINISVYHFDLWISYEWIMWSMHAISPLCFCIPFTYVLLGNKYIFIVIGIVVLWSWYLLCQKWRQNSHLTFNNANICLTCLHHLIQILNQAKDWWMIDVHIAMLNVNYLFGTHDKFKCSCGIPLT